MKLTRLAFAFTLGLSSFNLFGLELTVGITQYVPYADQAAEGYGLNAKIITAAMASVDKSIKVTYKFTPFQRIIDSVNKGEMQAGIFGKDAADKKTTSLDDYFIAGPCVFFYNKLNHPNGINFSKDHLENLKDYKIETLKGVFWVDVLKGKGLSVSEQSDDLNIYEKLRVKRDNKGKTRIDLWAAIDMSGIEIIKKKHPEEFKDIGMTEPFLVNGLSLIFSGDEEKFPDNKKLKEAFATGMKNIVRDGTYEKLAQAYYHGEKPPQLFSNDWKK